MDQMSEICEKLRVLLDKKPRKVAMFTHPTPDPDALGSMMAMSWFLSHFGCESMGFYDGEVSHPQNMAVVNLLDPGVLSVHEYFKNQDQYDFRLLVDTVPAHAGTNGQKW